MDAEKIASHWNFAAFSTFNAAKYFQTVNSHKHTHITICFDAKSN